MGIPSYFSHIVKSHRHILKKFNHDIKVNNLYIDCNSIIYDVVHNLNIPKLNEDETDEFILTEVCKSISNYISLINPDTKVFIAFDGVAPVAKLEQQRSRRYKSWFQNEIIKKIKKSSFKWEDRRAHV